MTNQAIFILVLPIGLFFYYFVFRSTRAKLVFLGLTSAALYVLGGWQFFLLLSGLALTTFWLALKRLSGLGILLNLLALVFFKYWNFGVGNIDPILNRLGYQFIIPYLSIGLPVGISFYVFKHIGYLIETRQGHYPPSRNFLVFFTFSAFFPQIVAGPISDYQQTSKQFSELPTGLFSATASEGLVMISMGLVKKVMIADGISAALHSQSIPAIQGFLPAWYLVIAFATQLYFDFSGYSDIARGLGRLFGVDLPVNFNNPYLASRIGQFWERWHISLSNWFRVYFFSPISRLLIRKLEKHKEIAQVLATLATMILIGLWHGAGWTFLLWGAYHGLLLAMDSRLRRTGMVKIPAGIQRAFLVIMVLIGWAIFMSPDLPSLGHLLGQMIGLGGFGNNLLVLVRSHATVPIIIGIAVAFSGAAETNDIKALLIPGNRWIPFVWGTLAALAILWMGTRVEFMYMQF